MLHILLLLFLQQFTFVTGSMLENIFRFGVKNLNLSVKKSLL
uniref:Uncharacterized protein n=1 Tax=Syphacia muris TaxID=451379 RepID=A0A0N5AJA3_9BILA